MTFDQFEQFILSSDCYWEHDVSYIDEQGNQHPVAPDEHWRYQLQIAKLLAEEKYTIKIEQMERYYKYDDRTVHLFYNPKFGPSFDTHTDPVDVIIDVLAGSKSLEVDGKEIILYAGDKLLIRAGEPHRALNYEKALMASHGINDTETLSRVRENNGDVQP